MKPYVCLGLLLSSLGAAAHEGHGLAGAHWHGTDVFGYVVLAVAIALAVWAGRRK